MDRKFSMKDMAQKIGVPLSTYRDWEYGRSIKGEPYVKISEALGISLQNLLGQTSANKEETLKKIKKVLVQIEEIKKEVESL